MNKIAVVLNSQAKNAKKKSSLYIKLLSEHFACEIFEIHPKNLNSTIEKCAEQFSTIIVGGGDGTLHSAAQYLVGKDISLGVIALGTLNHFAREMNLPMSPEELVSAIKAKNTLDISLATIDNVYIINNASIGFYPKLVEVRSYFSKYIHKFLAYLPAFVHNLVYVKKQKLNVEFGHVKETINTSFMMVSNGVYNYKFPIHFIRNDFTKKQLGIYYLRHSIFKNVFTKKDLFFSASTSVIIISSHDNADETLKVAIDGEVKNLKSPLKFSVAKDKLKIIIKK